MVTVIRDGYSGVLHTNLEHVIRGMRQLLEDRALAESLGARGRDLALNRFNIERFADDWYNLLTEVIREKTVLTAA